MRTKGKARSSPLFTSSCLSAPSNAITNSLSQNCGHDQLKIDDSDALDNNQTKLSIINKASAHSSTTLPFLTFSSSNTFHPDLNVGTVRLPSTSLFKTISSQILPIPPIIRKFVPFPTSSIPYVPTHNEYRALAVLRYRNKKLMRRHCCLNTKRQLPEIIRAAFRNPMSSIPYVPTQKEYRALAILRYRNKKAMRRHGCMNTKRQALFHPLSVETQSSDIRTDHSHVSMPLAESEAVSISAEKRFEKKNRKRKRTVPMGREHLQFIPHAPNILDSVPNCIHCGAKKFPHETPNLCCGDGDVTLVHNAIPVTLRDLLLNPCLSEPRSFKVMIRAYNNHLAFTSLGIKYDPKLAQRNKGVYTFRIQGQVYHWLNDLEPDKDAPKNLQFYFHDTDYELAARMSVCPDLDEQTLKILLDILSINPYARFFRSLSTIPCLDDHQIILKHNPMVTSKTYSKPTVSQVAVLLAANETSNDVGLRDIRVYKHSGESKTIQYYFGCYDPLQYPLMFPYGDPGWHEGIPRNDADDIFRSEEEAAAAAIRGDSSFVSLREYYSYKFQIRDDDRSYILQYGRLFQQYCVDMYVKIETQRLDFFRAKAKQEECRQEFLQGIVDAVHSGETEPSKIGQRIILPGTFIGGSRHMRRKYVDAMTLVQKFGKPDIFLTITCNPNWPEIKEQLLPSELTQDRPDLAARVFHAKVEELKIELFKKNIFGKVSAYTYVIEYQKRGLPHAHFLLILEKHYKLYSPDEYDQIVSAELPDAHSNPALYRAVVKHMLHGPCGKLNPSNVCMRKDDTCKDMYPREFCPETTAINDSYPNYRRRNDGKKIMVRGAWLDNRWVVPHSRYLVALLDCHINVEICTSIKAVKYIYKYICKGSDRILFQLSTGYEQPAAVDEIHNFVSARWISPPEAMWRIYRFPISEMKPPVIPLPLHLENYQPITFKNSQNLENLIHEPDGHKTMLTEFFSMNQSNETAQKLRCTYPEFPTHFVWLSAKKKWQVRSKGDSIGRIVTAHPTEGERFYLRMLLSTVRGPTSYESLKVHNGTVAKTFHEAARIRGLLEDDDSHQLCLEEACVFQMPYALRRLFASLLIYSTPSDPKTLYLKFEHFLSEDFKRDNNMTTEEVRNNTLRQINSFLRSMGTSLETYFTLDTDQPYNPYEDLGKEIRTEANIIVSATDLTLKHMLNTKQKEIFRLITATLNAGKSGAYFVDGPGGTGKTFLYRALLAEVRAQGLFALATAASGIAASILPGGRTAHSRFKIPLDSTESSTCRISKQSALAHLIKESKLIIWDEAPMAKRSALEALNDLLQDLMNNNEIFGGKVVVLGGDFRQTLPVVARGTKAETLNACLLNSPLWSNITKLHLTENMRAQTDPAFTSFLMSVGEGIGNTTDSGLVKLPSSCVVPATDDEESDLDKLIAAIYPTFQPNTTTTNRLNNSILTTKNEFVHEINSLMIDRFPGVEVEYRSYDETINPDLQGQYIDILNNLSPNGLPPHRLILKKNAPIILLRNLDPSEGLCNGTRLICTSLERNVIEAEISLGDFAGKHVFFHRIPLQPTNDECYPVPYKRVQFPIRLCFAMTINKAQGQTLDNVGVYLKEPVFSHGQLYVALSRARSSSLIKVLIKKNTSDEFQQSVTKNIVYKEVLNN